MNDMNDLTPTVAETAPVTGDKLRIQNLIAAVILISGLFVGSLFVDTAQLMRREGFSPRAVRESNVLVAAGKTWVAYPDPKVQVQVLTDSTCAACAPDEALVWFRRVLPTMEAVPVEASSEKGKALIAKFGISTVPAFVFGNEVTGTDFYGLANELFTEKDGSFLLDTAKLGLKPGKFLALPEIGDGAIIQGSKDASLKIVGYSDFQCPYSKAFQASVNQMLADYGDKVTFVYKHLPLSFHAQAENAALASECANEQGKFKEYSNILFERQAEWGVAKDTLKLKGYARTLGLKATDFNTCLDTKKYADKVATDAAEATKFGVDGTPGTFVGDTLLAGAVPYQDLKAAIDAKLGQ